MRLLLLSNSTAHGGGYLDHCADAIVSFLRPSVRRVLFVPYAAHDRDAYTSAVRTRFEAMSLKVDSVHTWPGGQVRAVEDAEAIFIGGGNTFRLIDALWRHELIEAIRARVQEGMPYIGSSAGSNVACPSIKTTNDMPIVQPRWFEALKLVPFNINPHYRETDPVMAPFSETRDDRIREYHVVNADPVLGLEEGSWVVAEDGAVTAHGAARVKLFRRGADPVWVEPGARVPLG